jgi:hypothetical protein
LGGVDLHRKFQQMTNLSALRIMMSSQLGNQNERGSKRDNCYACYSDLVDDVFRRLLLWLRYVCAAVAQARRELFDVLALPIQTAGHNVRPCPPGILDRWLEEIDRRETVTKNLASI